MARHRVKKSSSMSNQQQVSQGLAMDLSENNSMKAFSISSGQIVDRFATMTLNTPTASQGHDDVKKKKKKKIKKRKTKNISLEEAKKLAKNGKHEAMPFALYEYVRRATVILKRSGWPNYISMKDLDNLEIVEYDIGVICRLFKDDLPLCWKYEREHANSLIAGYHRVFTGDDRLVRII